MEKLKLGRYRHFKGNEYELIGVARHSETLEELVVYRALYGAGGLWVRPRAMWDETVTANGTPQKRFSFLGDSSSSGSDCCKEPPSAQRNRTRKP